MDKPKRVTAIKAIREFCKQCTGGDLEAIKTCAPLPDVGACALWPFRLGRNPNISEATKAKRKAAAKARGFGEKGGFVDVQAEQERKVGGPI